MPVNTNALLTVLNTTNLQKDNPRLYQVLQALVNNLLKNEQATAAVAASSGGGGGGGGVGGSGTTGDIAQWSAATTLTNVDAAGISAALDLL